MQSVKIVVRYADGRIVKGYTQDFFPNKPLFHLFLSDVLPAKDGVEVLIQNLKALFFVRDFDGNAAYNEKKHFAPAERPTGRTVEVTFKDGEVLVGTTLGYDPKRQGFFLFPADPQSNNMRIFAISESVRQVRYL